MQAVNVSYKFRIVVFGPHSLFLSSSTEEVQCRILKCQLPSTKDIHIGRAPETR